MAKKKKRSSFKNKVAHNSHKQKTQGSAYGYLRIPKGVELFKEEPGTRVLLDFLPYEVTDHNHADRDDDLSVAVPGELWYKRPFLIHRNVGVSNDTVVCPITIGKRCPICEYRAKRVKEGADKKELRALRASQRNLYVVVPINHKEYDEKPHLWDISQFLFQDMLNDEIDDDPDNAIFPDLEEGLTLRIRFSEGNIGGNKFAETSRIDFKERKQGYDEDILDRVPNLDECLTILSYDKLESLFFELEDEEVAESEEEETPPFSADDADDDEDIKDDSESDEDETDKEDSEENGTMAEDADTSDDDEEDPPALPQKTKPRRRKPKSAKKEENPCPFGHRFGKDCEKFDDCDECEKWDECIDASEEA